MRISELRNMSEEELIRRHDQQMGTRTPHYNVFLDELARREMVRQGKRMAALTRSLNRLTWWIVVLTVLIAITTIVGVGLTAAALLSGA